jgi:non-specific serine/threonine protein kinase
LLVKQNLVAEGERVVAPPEALPDDTPAWLRVATEYFRPPKKRAKRLTRGRQIAPGAHELRGDDLPEFIEKDLPDLKQAGRVLMQPEVSAIRVVTAAPEVRTAIDFDEEKAQIKVRPRYRSGAADLKHDEVTKQAQGRRYMRAGSSFHRIDWEQVERVNRAVADAGLVQEADGSYVAPALHFNEIVNTFSRLGLLSETEVFQRFRERLLDFSKIESVPLPTTLRTDVQVRDYQRAGYDWLAFLKNHGLPGVLADEMGLGKTLQALLAVAHFRDRYGPCPSLVVCPAALVEKWVDETGKFFRGLRGISHAGSRRGEQLRENIGGADVVVTSYETLVRDADLLARWRWRFVIADEAQRVKNPGTQRARAVRKIPAEARIAITGTPVENRLLDLWSIFDFLAAGYLGTATEFQRGYEEPIKRGNRQAVDTLTRKTRPFLLRRLKRHVAKELPEKLLKPMRCDLTPSQRELYSAVLARDFEAAITAAGGKKLSLGNPHILAVLTKLKQICCHPGLITHDFQPYKPGVSGKFDTFMEVLEEIMDAEAGEEPHHKLVGFSQYVLMAGFLADYIRSLRKSCAVIDGSVPPRDRPNLCKEFNADDSQFGMMLTLSSGGVGLDLQSANYVVMYDRWWNPAVEDQAIDRVHRLGQERQVVVITLTTRGTLEERIEVKLEGKRSLSGMVIQADEFMRKEVTRDELLELVKLD